MRELLRNMKMTKKLLVSPFVAVLFLFIFGITCYVGFFKQKAALDDVFNNRFTYFQTASDFLIDLKEVHANVMDLVSMLSQSDSSPKDGNPTESNVTEQRESGRTRGFAGDGKTDLKRSINEVRTNQIGALEKAIARITEVTRSKHLSKEEMTGFVHTREQAAKYRDTIKQAIEALEKDPLSAQPIMLEATDLFVEINKKVHELLEVERKLGNNQYVSAGVTFKLALVISLIVFAAAVILPFGISLFMKSLILSPIKTTIEAIETVAQGDLTRRIDVMSSDEIGGMARHFNIFIDRLHEVIAQVAVSSDKVFSAAGLLDNTSAQMSEGIESIAARLDSVATASEEMSNTTTEIAQNCVKAVKSSEKASNSAVTGETIVQSTMSVMNRISERVAESSAVIKGLEERSNQIGDVVDLINNVADQTNLLALNAAIEAARAGEHGRGFAVVAEEVRKLAETTSDATKEIGNTIRTMQVETKKAVASMEEGVAEVGMGTDEAAKSGRALKEILQQITAVTSEINQIAVASEEETATTDEIATSIQKICAGMQQAASKVQVNANASHQLADLSKELKEMVGQFRL